MFMIKAFNQHKSDAAKRGVPFLLTFEEWCDIWIQSGLYHLRGRGKGLYCMSRYGDQGPYAVGNVYINLFSQNSRDYHLGKPKPHLIGNTHRVGKSPWNKGIPYPSKKKGIPMKEEQKELLRQNANRSPKPSRTCPHCGKVGAGPVMSRYHFDRCPLNALSQA